LIQRRIREANKFTSAEEVLNNRYKKIHPFSLTYIFRQYTGHIGTVKQSLQKLKTANFALKTSRDFKKVQFLLLVFYAAILNF